MNQGRSLIRRAGSRKKAVRQILFLFAGLLLATMPVSPAFASTGVVSLPANFSGFVQHEFSSVAGVSMNGQILSVDFLFADGPVTVVGGPVWSEAILQTGPHNAAGPGGDYPYDQYVVFGRGTAAYLIDENGRRIDAPMSDWSGGLTTSPGPTSGVLFTDRGWVGADMLAYPPQGQRVAGIHFDFVLPSTGETLQLGRIGVKADVNVSPEPVQEMPPPPPAPAVLSTSLDYAIPNLGTASRITGGNGPMSTGYARIHAGGGSTTPSGLVIFGNRQDGILVSEAAVGASPLRTSGRIYAEVSSDGVVNTGIAIANPNANDAAINFEIRDEQGNILRIGSFTLTGVGASCDAGNICNHLASFLDGEPFFGGTGIRGTLSFTSSTPVSVIALRSFYNERSPSEFLMTTLPVVDLSAGITTDAQVVPHFAAGAGMTTQILLVNPSGTRLAGTLEFLDRAGSPALVSIDGSFGGSVSYSVAPNSSRKIVVTAADTQSGSVWISPAGGGPAPVPLVILSYKPGAVTVSEAGVPVAMGTAFRVYGELSTSPDIRTGVAIANATHGAGTVTLSFTGLDSNAPPVESVLSLPASGQIVGFLDTLMPALAGQSAKGVLRVTTDLSSISVVGLRGRVNERQDFLVTTTPPALENDFATSEDRILPHLVSGGGFTTEIILFSGTAGQTSSGTVSFVQSDSTPLSLDIH